MACQGPIVSIIIPVFRAESYISFCLESCLSQKVSKKDFEIVVVNDGLLDKSLSILEGYVRQYDNIHLICQSHIGPGGARNVGMRSAQGEYFLFLDADDRIREDSLSFLLKILKVKKPDCLAFCAADVCDGKYVRRNTFPEMSNVSGIDLLKRGVSPCATFTLWNAKFLNENGLCFQDRIFHEDCEFTPRAYYYAKTVLLTNEIVYLVYPNPNSITRSVNPKKSFDLINTVCRNLSAFANQVEENHRYLFYNLVALYVNNAIANILRSELNQQVKLNETICNSQYLWSDMKKSTVLKYSIEAVLFKIFSSYPLSVYKFLQHFNHR